MEVLGVEGGRSWSGVVLTKSTRGQLNTSKTLYPGPGYMDYSPSSVLPAMSIHNHGPSLSLEIDLLFKVTRVSQCVFTTIRFRERNTSWGT